METNERWTNSSEVEKSLKADAVESLIAVCSIVPKIISWRICICEKTGVAGADATEQSFESALWERLITAGFGSQQKSLFRLPWCPILDLMENMVLENGVVCLCVSLLGIGVMGSSENSLTCLKMELS